MNESKLGNRQKLIGVVFLAPAVIYMLAFYGFPIVKNFVMSFQDYSPSTFYTGEAPFVAFENYKAVMGTPLFGKVLLNTVIFTVGSLFGQFTIGLALAIFFNRTFKGAKVMRSLLLLPWLIPMIASSAIWRWILDKDSRVLNRALESIGITSGDTGWLTSSSLALFSVILVNIWIGIPFNTTILFGGLQDIDQELYEAAAIDGANGFQRFRKITWPLLRPVVNVVLILGVVYTVKVLDLILGLTGGGPANATQTLATQSYRLSFTEFNFGQGAALSTLLVVLSVIFAAIYLRANRKSNLD